MVTIVNGSALGLQSWLPGTRSNVGSNVQGQNPDQVYVNSATGNLVVQDQDELLSSIGSALSIVRTYNSQGTFGDPSGNNWSLSVNQFGLVLTGTVNTAGSTVVTQFGDGSQITYTYNATLGLYTAALGNGPANTISFNASTGLATWTDGETRETQTYGGSSGLLMSSTDSSGNVTTYTYNGTLLTQITDPSGQTTNLDYSGNNLVDIREVSNGATQKRVQYTYDSANRLSTVSIDLTPANNSSTDPTYVTTYTYQGTTDLLASITQSDGTKVSFQYVNNNGGYQVSQVTDGNGNVTRFSYSGSAGVGPAEYLIATANPAVLSTTSPPYYTVPAGATWASIAQAVYGATDPNAAAQLQTDMGNPPLTAGLQLDVPLPLVYVSQAALFATTTVTDALGNVTTYTQQANTGRLTSVATPLTQTNYTYDTNGDLLTSTQDPSGLNATTTYTYDSNGNLLSSVDAAGETTTYTYNSDNQLLTKTGYLVPASGSAAASVPITTRYVYDGNDRLRFSISAVGNVTEYRYNALGQRTSQLVYGGTDVYSLAGLSASTAPTLAQMTSWAGALSQTQNQSIDRTDYTYDFRGNLSTATIYSATSTSGAGAGTASTTQYIYDQRGQLLQVIDPRGIANAPNAANSNLPDATTYTYDGLGRVLTETQWVSTVQGVTTTIPTSYVYTASSNTIQTTFANGLVTTKVYDKAGHLISVANSGPGSQALGTTTYQYDADGRLAITTDPTGDKQYLIYDANGRQAGEVDVSGDGDGSATLTQYVYDNANELVKTVRYADYLSAATVATLTNASGQPATVSIATLVAALPTTVGRAFDQITRSVYDAAWRKVYDIDAAGDVTQYFYDGAGRLTSQTQYATPVSIAASVNALTPSQVGVTASAGNDRKTSYFYDNDGRLVGELDPRGYLTQSLYDAAGELTEKIAYAVAAPTASYAGGQWSNLPVASFAQDEVSANFYDAEGHLVGSFASAGANTGGTAYLGYFTQTQYDTNNNIASVTQYAQSLTYTAGASTGASMLATAQAAAAVQGATAPHVTSYQYDGLNQVTQETNFEGTVTNYVYDNAGHLISQTVAVGSTIPNDTRTTQIKYDALGRVTAQLSAAGSALLTGSLTQAQINAIWAEYGTSYTYDAAGRRTSQTVTAYNPTTGTTQTETTQYFYNEAGQLRFTMNALGEVTENQYNALGQLTAEVSYYNRVSNPAALTGGLLTSSALAVLGAIANASNAADTVKDKKTTYTYKLNGKLATQTTVEGSSVTYGYNAFGDVNTSTTVVDASHGINLVRNFTYDLDGDLFTEQSDPTGANQLLTYGYDAFDRQTSVTDQYGNKTSTQYDPLGRVLTTTDAVTNAANGSTGTATSTKTTYDAFSRVLTTTDAYGNVTQYKYDDVARSVTVTSPEGVSVTTVHNRDGQTLTVTTATNTTSYTYNLDGEVTGISDNLGSLESRQYDSAGREVTDADANNILTTFGYDAANRVLTRTVDPSGLNLTTSYAYDGEGRAMSTTSPDGVVTTTQYDADGRIHQVAIDPTGLNLVTQYSYNNEGDTVTLTQGLGSSNPRVTQYTYDALGRRTTQVVDPGTGNNPATGQPHLNLKTQYFYDANSNLTQKIDANGNSTWYVYDADNRVHYTVNALGGITETDYDGNGRVSATRQYATAITPPAATVHQLTVTPVTSSADRLSRSYYDIDGNEVYTIDAAGTVTQRTYDTDGEVIQLRVINGAALTGAYATTAAVTAALGSAATTLGATDRVQWTAYDARGRAILNIDALGDVTQTQYDGDGNVVSSTAYATPITPPAALVTSLSANVPASGPPQIVVNGNTSGTITVASSSNDRLTRYWYDTAGRQVFTLSAAGYLTQTLYNDAAHTQTVTVYATPQTIPTTATTSQLKNGGVTIATSAGTSLSTPTGSVVVGADQTTKTFFDAAGRVSQVTDALGHSESYTYDALGNKLTYTNKSQQTWTYKYDADGRLIEEDSPYVSVSNVTASGSALTATPVTASIVTLMMYDGLGNVTSLTEGVEGFSNGTRNTTNSRVTTYGYDALGRQTSAALPSVPVYNGISSDTVVVSESGTAIGSNSSVPPLTTQVVYDTLGDEIASKDAGNNWTYKVYDPLGRVVYQIDALNFVTGYTYDAFGNQKATTRYNTTLSTTATGGTTASIAGGTLLGLQVTSTNGNNATIAVTNSNGASPVTSQVYVVAASGQDRTITTSYDLDNRVSQVSQPQVFSFDLVTNESGGQQPSFTAAPTIQYAYNAFGQVVRTATLVNPTGTASWAYSFAYYDRAGNKTADINADGYLTTYQYDAEGNLTGQYQYAQALTVSGATSTTTAPSGTQAPNDRQTQFQYDQLNRKVAQTLLGVQYLTASGVATANATTFYGYDALGNQTSVSANGGTTYTYYDVLGRVIATVGPAPGDSSSLTPLTLMQRDVYGNLVAQTQYAAGLTSTSGNAAPTTANTSPDVNKDRTTLYLRDVEGHALETEQLLTSVNSGEGNPINNIYTYDVYDARGNLVKQYQPANATDTLVTFYTYDALGRETDVISPELVGSASEVSDQFTDYDAFGEVKGKGTVAYGAQKTDAEVFYYDQAGRVFLTNASGAYTAYLYDLFGNATGMLQEQTGATAFPLSNLTTQSSAASAYAAYNTAPNNTDGLLFTQTGYDAMGNVLETLLPTYSSPNPIEAMTNTGVQVQTINGTTYLTWFAPADSTLTPTLYIDGANKSFQHVPNSDGTGNEYGYEAEYALTGLPNGAHTYLIQYTRPTLDINGNPIVAGETTGTFNVGQSLTPIVTSNPGTVGSVSASLSGTSLLLSWVPDNTSVVPTFSILVGGTWQSVTGTIGENGVASASLTAPGPGTYQYRITDTLTGETEAQGTGTLTITGSTTTTSLGVSAGATGTVTGIGAVVSGSTTFVSWQADSGVTSASFQILIGGTWTAYTPTLSESGVFSVSLPLPAAGTYQYQIADQVQGMTEAQATGNIAFTAAVTTTSLTNSSETQGTVSGVTSSVSGSTVFVSWTPDIALTSAAFAILIGGTWTSYTPTLSESGVYTVSFPLPAAGTYQYRITDFVQGNDTEAQGVGNISFTAASTGVALTNSSETQGTVSGISSSVSGTTAFVSWSPDIALTSATFAILIGGTWTSYTPTLSESGVYTASFALPAAGTYQYRITDFVQGNDTEAQGVGNISFTAASSNTSTTGSSTPSAVWTTPSPVTASAGVGTQGSGAITSSATPVQQANFNENGQITSYTDYWSGTDAVSLNWLNLASGSYTLNIFYNTAANSTYGISSVAASRSFAISGGSGGSFSWTDTANTNSFFVGGISSISYFQILQSGSVVRDSRSAGVTTATISWAAPADTSYVGALYYRVTGTSSYSGVGASRSGSTFQASLSELAPGTYDYIVEDYQVSGESAINLTQVTGQFVVGSSSASISSQNGTPGYLSGVAASGSTLTWARAMQSGDTLQVQVVSSGGTTYTLSPSSSNGTNYSASFNGLPSGSYSYTINYINGGSTYLEGAGTLSINTTTTTTPATSSIGTATQLATVTGFADLGNGNFGWNTAANSGDTIVFHYKTFGASTWAGSLTVSGSSPSYSVNLNGLSGTLEYEVDYIASGAAQPYRVGRGEVTISTTTTPATSSIGTPTQLSTVTGFADRGGGIFGWNTASNSGDTIVFHYKTFGASTWAGSLTVSGSSPSYSVNLNGLSGTLEYEVDYIASGAAQPYRVGRGEVTITTTTTPGTASVGTPTQLLAVSGVADQGNGIFGWNTAANTGDTVVFHYKAAGASTWAGTLTVSGSSPSYSVNLSGLSGAISYEIDYIASGATQPYRVGWGGVTITRTTTPGTAGAGAPVNLSAISGFQDLGNGVLGWTTAANSGDTIQFHYKTAGATSWAGTLPVSGTGPYSVNLSGLSGTIAYEIDYIASGAAQPYRAETGTVTISTGISAVQDTTSSTLQATAAAPYELQTVDRWGNILSSTNTAHQTTTYTYNVYNELLTTTDPSVKAVAVAMSATGNTGTVAPPQSATPTSYNYYDLYGNLVETQDADGNINKRGYNLENQLTSVTDADSGQTTYVYDAFGDQIQVTTNVDPLTRYKTLNAYDQAGRLTDTEQELAQNTFTSAGVVVNGFASSLLPASNVNVIRTQYRYDQAGRRIATVDGAGESTLTGYDLHGNVTATTTALGATTSYGYDLENRKTSETDPDGNQQSWTYDYFDRLLNHRDFGGTLSTYTYDTAGSGLLTKLTSTGGQFAPENQTYSYDSANHLVQIHDTGVNSTTTYYYDTAGRVERQQTTDGGLLAEDTSTQYDALGRIANISGLGYSVSYAYDQAGNRTNIDAYYTTGTGSVSQQNYWYGYDKMNRVLISEGAETGTTIAPSASQGTILTYDWRGDRTSATTEATNFPLEFLTTESGTTYATYGTDAADMAYYQYTYDGAGRLLTTTVRPAANSAATPAQIDARQYDQASRITQEATLTVTSGNPYFDQQTNHYNADGTLLSTLTTQNGHEASFVNYAQVLTESGQVINGYDAAGNLIGFEASNYDPTTFDSNNNSKLIYTSQDTFTYAWGNTYLESSQNVVNQAQQGAAPGNGTTNYVYNADQQLIQFTDSQKAANNRAFLNNANGQVLTVALGTDGKYGVTGSSTTTYGSDPGASAQFGAALMAGNAFFQAINAQYFFYDSNGKSVGTFGELAGKLTANFDVNFTPISQQYPAQEPPQYVVQAGDSLASIAARVYGDASLWYIIAQANGLTGDGPSDAPSAGTALTLPNVVVALPNSAQSFKPSSISQALGDTTPYQAPPPPPQSGGNCGVLGTIFAAIVTAVATYFSWGILTTAVAAAFADALGQEADIALGNQSSFSWSQVAETGIGAGVTAGLNEFAPAVEASIGISSPAAQLAVNAAIGNAVSQGVAIGFGDQKGFNWMEVAATAAAAPIAQAVGTKLGSLVGQEVGDSLAAQEFSRFAGQVASGEINSVAVATFSGGKINYGQVVADAFGNAVGDSIAHAVAGPPAATPAATPNAGASAGNQNGPSAQDLRLAALAGNGNTAIAAGSSLSAQSATLTNNLDLRSLQPTLQEITFDANSISAPYIVQPGDSLSTIAGTSNPAVIGEMTRENGLAGSKIYPGEVINLPDGNIQPGDQQSGQNTLNSNNATLDALLQPVVVTAQRIAVDLSAGSSSTQVPAGAPSGVTATSRRVTLPEFDNSSYVAPGFIASSYYSAEAAAEDSNNSIGDRLINGVLAIASAPLALVEEVGRGILNVPYMAQRLGQDLAVANLTTDTDTKVLAYLDAVSSGATAFNSAAGVAAPFAAAENTALPQVPLQSAESWAAARATYTAEGAGPAESISTSAPAASVVGDVAPAAGDNAAHSAYQYDLLKLDLLRQEVANPGEVMSGPVVLRDPVAGATPEQVAQIRQYVDIANLSIDEGYMSPTGRVSTAGQMRTDASAAAAEERSVAEAQGTPYTEVVGHGPDTTWTGNPVPPFWLDMNSSVNSSLGRQAQNYPIGYTPTRFIYEGDLNWTGNGNW